MSSLSSAIERVVKTFKAGAMAMLVQDTQLFINGEFVDSISGKTFPTVNPATEDVICHVQEAQAEDVDKAVQAAKAAFHGPWREIGGSGRRDLINKLADLMEQNKVELAVLESLNNGKPVSMINGYGSETDLTVAIKCLRCYAGWADKIEGKTLPVEGDYVSLTLHQPIGVVGQLGPALAAGCTMVLKSSEKTPITALCVARLIKEAGFPKGVVNILLWSNGGTGYRQAHGCDQGRLHRIDCSRLIAQYAAESNMKKVSLELGGKSPLIVMADADLELAHELAQQGLFLNQDTIYDKFVEIAVQKAKARVVGDPTDPATQQGPQVAVPTGHYYKKTTTFYERNRVDDIQFKRVLGFIEKGKDEGAKLLTGGDRFGSNGYFIQPTVFGDVTDDMTIAKEEIFGPVMSILKFTTVDEVICRANATRYGLAAGVCTKDIGLALKMSKELNAGTVWINCYNKFDAATPFGGFKESGWGREGGPYGLDNYLEVKCVNMPIAPTTTQACQARTQRAQGA